MNSSIPLPPAIVVHGLAHAEAALAAAAGLGVAVTLISAEGAAGYAGPSWFRMVVEEARAAHPEAQVTAVLDCGDMPGYALAALRDGAQIIRFSGDTADKIADIAAQCGAQIIAERPAALDLAPVERARRDLERACRDWLEKHANG
ncbi:MAG: hypothetical protein JSU82_17790 [Rhodospirillales bacterium]|nr:MAG: hypothetical protein JSU82_17790 [Rhodospirillales bacterium]